MGKVDSFFRNKQYKIINNKAMTISKKVTQKNYANTAKEKVVIAHKCVNR